MKKLISIGLPVVKKEYFESALNSALDQTYPSVEIILLNNADDLSVKNHIAKIVKKYDGNRIFYYENEFQIPAVENWNKVLSYARGDYFVLFSDDDIYEPDFLAEMQDLFNKYPNADIAHCRVKIIDGDNNTIGYSPICPVYENVIDFIWHRFKGFRTQYASDFMMKTTKLKESGGFVDLPLAWGTDDATWFKLAKQNGIVYSNKVLCHWRCSNINISRRGDPDLRIKANITYNKWANDFISDIKAISEQEIFQINEIRQLIFKWKRNNIINILMVTSGDGFFSLFKVIQLWIKFRVKYHLDLIIIIRAAIFKIKKLLFN